MRAVLAAQRCAGAEEKVVVVTPAPLARGVVANVGRLPDLIQMGRDFESCGVSLGKQQTYRIMLSMQRLLEAQPLERVRFFGKIFGRNVGCRLSGLLSCFS